ncbi:MAG: membrane protein insertion efficiency factor YidD [Bacilli bacterium]|nr:membrane protein insertion efficiency factor YidD [Bacilli bacterium]
MNKLIIKLIRLYQRMPLEMHKACRFTPTCSNYAIEAYSKYNFITATKLSIKRILRCRPFGKVGYDPVPEKEYGGTYEKIN